MQMQQSKHQNLPDKKNGNGPSQALVIQLQTQGG